VTEQGARGKERLAAFSDGVIAIIITIMVLELKVPHGADWVALGSVVPNFVSYVLASFTWRSTGTIIIISFTPSPAWTGSPSGLILICCSGFQSFQPRRPGWR